MAEAAKERDSAIGLFIDEVQYLSHQELAALIVACHEMAQQNLPFLFIGAGLPQLAALAGNAKSYAERLFTYPQMGPLELARQGMRWFTRPRTKVFFSMTMPSTEMLRVTECYPYFLQEWGFQVWNASARQPYPPNRR